MTLTIAYTTNRIYPAWDWFFDSLRRERETDNEGPIKTIVVDFHQRDRANTLPPDILHVPPKPTCWQGPHRFTQRDYFAASNARNTALCLAENGYIAYVDDLSVLCPNWLKCVRQAMRENYVVCGAYQKVYGLEAVNGEVQSFIDYPHGHDARWSQGSDEKAVRIGAGAVFGCSLAMPIELLLRINGWDEGLCDGMSYEDTAMGLCLWKQGADVRYDRRMMTYESEELHHTGVPFLRIDKKMPNPMPECPDASHAMLQKVMAGNGVSENAHLGPGGIREMRRRVLAGENFPVPTEPRFHWVDGMDLKTM